MSLPSFAESESRAISSVTRPSFDVRESRVGAWPVSVVAACGPPPPFFQDQNQTLSRPAHLRDYQGDAAAYPYRKQRPDELAPVLASPAPAPAPASAAAAAAVLPRYTSEAEQKWLQERDARARDEMAASAAQSNSRRDFSQPPPPFESKLGFRSPAPFPPPPQVCRSFGHKDGVSNEFFWGGTGRFVSENGQSNAQKYYSLARPLGGRLKSHYAPQTTPYGYTFTRP